MTRFVGKQAIVTGAGSGIGAALCRALAGSGADVVCTDVDGEAAARTAASLTKPGTARQLDVTDEASVAALFDATGPIDVVVNTAGFGGFGRITEQPVEDFRAIVDCCLTGGFIVMKHAGRHLRDGGSLVSITSLNARLAAPGMSAYCAAKAGLAMLTQVGALEFGPRGIRVNAVSPGFVHTPLTELVTMARGAHLKRYPDVLAHVDRMASA